MVCSFKLCGFAPAAFQIAEMVAKEMPKSDPTQPGTTASSQQKAEDFLYQTEWLASGIHQRRTLSANQLPLLLKAFARHSVGSHQSLTELLSTLRAPSAGLRFSASTSSSDTADAMR